MSIEKSRGFQNKTLSESFNSFEDSQIYNYKSFKLQFKYQNEYTKFYTYIHMWMCWWLNIWRPCLLMPKDQEILEVKISEIDLYLINKVRELRVSKNISQLKLSIALGLSEGAISKIENPKQRAKYNIRHLNLLAKSLNCEIADLLPKKPLKNDLIIAKLKVVRNSKINSGEPNYIVVSKTPIKNSD